jgi:hypothetical protein
MSNKSNPTVVTMGVDIGKNSYHVVGLDQRGSIVLRQKWSRGQIEARLANMPPCLMAFSNGTVCSSPIRRQISSASNALSTSLVFEGL